MKKTVLAILIILWWLGCYLFYKSDYFQVLIESDNIHDKAQKEVIGMNYELNGDTFILVNFTGGFNPTFTLSNGVEISEDLILDSAGIRKEIVDFNK